MNGEAGWDRLTFGLNNAMMGASENTSGVHLQPLNCNLWPPFDLIRSVENIGKLSNRCQQDFLIEIPPDCWHNSFSHHQLGRVDLITVNTNRFRRKDFLIHSLGKDFLILGKDWWWESTDMIHSNPLQWTGEVLTLIQDNQRTRTGKPVPLVCLIVQLIPMYFSMYYPPRLNKKYYSQGRNPLNKSANFCPKSVFYQFLSVLFLTTSQQGCYSAHSWDGPLTSGRAEPVAA